VVTGDVLHHPAQCAEPGWGFLSDDDAEAALATRRRLLDHAARTAALVIGTHFPTRPAGRVVADGPAWRFVPVD
jgi:glyoxylase-like metal-dependent hydrolase (beta-lactamase superfamily II)